MEGRGLTSGGEYKPGPEHDRDKRGKPDSTGGETQAPPGECVETRPRKEQKRQPDNDEKSAQYRDRHQMAGRPGTGKEEGTECQPDAARDHLRIGTRYQRFSEGNISGGEQAESYSRDGYEHAGNEDCKTRRFDSTHSAIVKTEP